MSDKWHRMVCWLLGHQWKQINETTRVCRRCPKIEMVWMNRAPRIGEPTYYWGETLDDIHKRLDENERND